MYTETQDSEPEYDAFISYSRKDKGFAESLEKALESYAPPKDLAVAQRHLRIFRDEGDLTGTEYYNSIEEHLANSSKLIVICTPDARDSEYVNDEIARFARLASASDIIPVLLNGLPNNVAGPGQDEEKAFPEALCEVLKIPLAISYVGFVPGETELRKGIFEGSWYSLLANIYQLSRSEIEQRDRRRLQKRKRIAIATVSAIMLALTVLAGVAMWQRDIALEQRDEALRSQSIYLARQSREQNDAGRSDLAIKLAIEGLPSWLKEPERPYVATTEMALYAAVAKQRFHSILDTKEPDLEYVELSPDGRRAITVNSGIVPHVRIWNMESSELIASRQLSNNYVSNVAISADSRYLAVAFWHPRTFELPKNIASPEAFSNPQIIPNQIHIYALEDGKLLDRFSSGAGEKNYVAFGYSPGQLLVSNDEGASVFEILTECPKQDVDDAVPCFPTEKSNAKISHYFEQGTNAEFAEFSPDGSTLVLVNDAGLGVLLDLTGKKPFRFISHPEHQLELVRLSSDSEFAVALTKDGTLLRVESLSGVIISEVPVDAGDKYIALDVSDKVNRFRAISLNGLVSSWDMLGSEPVTTQRFDSGGLRSAFLDDSAGIAIVAHDGGGSEMWSLENGTKHLILGNDEASLVDASIGRRGKQVLIATDDKLARLFSTQRTGGSRLLVTGDNRTSFAEFTRGGDAVVVGYKNGAIELRDIATNTVSWSVDAAHKKPVRHISFDSSGQLMVTASGDGSAKIWKTTTGELVHELIGHKEGVSYAIFSPDDKQILTASNDETSRLWDATQGELVHELPLPREFYDPIHNASILPQGVFTADGRYVITVSAGDGYVIEQPALIWDRKSGELMHTLKHQAAIWGLALTPDQRSVITTSYDHTAAVWDIGSGTKLKTLTGHSWTVTNAEIYPDMRHIATSSNDRTVRIWDFESGRTLHTLEGHSSGILALKLSEDGQVLASGDGDGNIRLWDARSGYFIMALAKQGGVITHLTFTKARDKLMSVSNDGTTYLHFLPPTGQQLINQARSQYVSDSGSFLTTVQRARFGLEEY